MNAYPYRALSRAALIAVVVSVPSALVAGPLGGPGLSGRAPSVDAHAGRGTYYGGGAYAGRGAYVAGGAYAGAGPRSSEFPRFNGFPSFNGARGAGYGSYVIPPAYASAGFPPYVYGGYGYAPYGYAGGPRGASAGAYDGNAARVLDGGGASLARGNGPLPYAPPTVYRIADREGRGGGSRVSVPGTGFQGGDPALPRIITVRP